MAGSLSAAEVRAYREDGLLFPKRAVSTAGAARLLGELEAHEAGTGGPVNGKHRYKCHLLFPWIDETMRDPAILDMVESLVGPDIMVWTSHLYPKEPGDGRFISWHQDSAHWGLDSDRIVTVWIALTPATRENGCMRMLPGSQRTGTVAHRDTWDPDNILTRGQTIDAAIEEDRAVSVELAAGEASLHHVFMWHASHANRSGGRRVGLALRYITPDARQTRTARDFATLVRGEDRFGHFEPEPRPRAAMDPEFVRLHEEIAAIQGAIYLDGTDRAGLQGLSDDRGGPSIPRQ